jgi:Dolichyl-phosphate-mannose-protein mannosyltransferase
MLATRPLPAAMLVGLLTAAGVAIRVAILDQSLFADELATYWVVSTNGLGGVISTVHGDAEITPPLVFAASWLSTQIDLTKEMLRLPSLLAGVATIPTIYLLGRRTVGRPAALVAAALTTLSPFMIYYAAEARSYALMMFFVTLSTLAMLLAVDTRRTRWWVLYAACSSAAVYTHYTSVFALGAQALWLLWALPEARKAAILANLAAAAAFLPWITGLRNDFDSPTTEILSFLTPFDFHAVRVSLTHVAFGYPYDTIGLREMPGEPALAMLALALLIAVASLAVRVSRTGVGAWLRRADRRVVLVVGLALAVPLGEAVVSAIGTNIFGGRNLAAAWPPFALSLAALLVAAGPRLRYVAVALCLAAFAIAAGKLVLDDRFQRRDYLGAAEFIDRHARPGDVVVDAAVFSPGPYSSLDVALRRPHRIIRYNSPAQRVRPFGVFDRIVPVEEVIPRAAADGGRVFLVVALGDGRPAPDTSGFPPGYRVVETRTYPGTHALRVQVWAGGAATSSRG